MRKNAGGGAWILRARGEPELIGHAVEQFVEAFSAERIQHHPVHDQIAGPEDVARVETLLVAAVDDRNRVPDVLHPRHQLRAEDQADGRRWCAALESVTEAQREFAERVTFLVPPHERAENQAVVRKRQGGFGRVAVFE